MYNTYISSTITLRCKGSISLFNDSSFCLNDRFDKHPLQLSSHSSSYCACCANSIYRVPIYPTFLYGLRQSSLIPCSPYKKLIFGGVDQHYLRFRECYVDPKCCYEELKSFEERSVCEQKSKRGHLCDVDEAEVVRSLLTEEVGGECFGVRERNGSRSSRRVEVDKRGNDSCSCYRKKKKVDSGVLESNSKYKYELQVGKRGNNGGARYNGKKKNFGVGALQSNLKSEYESVMFKSREEDKGWKEDKKEEEREHFLRGENPRARVRKEESSCSSFYSCSSPGDWEGDSEVEVKHEGYVEESSSGHRRDSRKNGEITYDEKVAVNVQKHGNYAKENGVVLKKGSTIVGGFAASSSAERDWRKQSEKKLTENEEIESLKESSEKQLRNSEVHDSCYGKVSGSHRRYNDRKEKLNIGAKIDDGTRRQYSQAGDQVSGQSESTRKYKQFTEVSEMHCSNVEVTSGSLKRHSGWDENLTASLVQDSRGEYCETAGRNTRQGEYRRSSQQRADVLESKEIRGTSETMKNRGEENSTMILNSVGDTDMQEQHYQAGQWVTSQIDSRGKSQHLTEISDDVGIDVDSTFISRRQSETRINKLEENSNSVSISYPKAREQCPQTDPTTIRAVESRKGPQEVTNISTIHYSGGTVTDTNKRLSGEDRYSTSVLTSVEEIRDGLNTTDERVLKIGSREEAQRSSKVLSFHQDMSQQTSSSQASLKLNIESRVQPIGVIEGDRRSSQEIVILPSSRFGARDPPHTEASTEFATQEISNEVRESDSSVLRVHTQESNPALQHEIYGETHGEPFNFLSHATGLDSADRFQKSSEHFVDAFVEKVRHELSTSEIQKEKKTSEPKLVHNDDQHKQKNLSQYGSGDFQPKEHGSMSSYRSSGTNGPSSESWDVTGPLIQEQTKTEVPEDNTTAGNEGNTSAGNADVKRSGRSLWSTISNIVLLRWTSNSEHLNSTSKSSGRSSPNKSMSSEAWFSGHEPDENSDGNVRKERRTLLQEPTVDQQQVERILNQSLEVPSSSNLKDKRKHLGSESLSFSSMLESGSASKGVSLPSSEVTFGKNFEGTTSGTGIADSSHPLRTIRIRSPGVEEISEAGKADGIGSGTMVQLEQPVLMGVTEETGTEGKDGELRRRKFQRNNQVIKDRFDEWEEAYILENEQRKIDEVFMREALLEAKKAADSWEVPVGAVLVHNGKVIARGCNLVEELRDATAHAEMFCIREASNILRTWRLSETTLYVTLEPCPMCAGAILQARIDTVVWGAPNKLLGADGSWIRLFPSEDGGNGSELTDKPAAPVHPFHTKMTIRRGVLASECADAMQQFFQLRRKKEKKSRPSTPPSCLPISNHPSKFFTKMHDAFNIMFCL